MTALDQAIERMEAGAPLPEEPGSNRFMADPDGKPYWYSTGSIPYRRWVRWDNARKRLRARRTRAVVKVCINCSAEFQPQRCTQVRCASCIAKVRELKRDAS